MKQYPPSEFKLPIDPVNVKLFNLFNNYLESGSERPVFNTIKKEELLNKLSNQLEKDGKGADYLFNILNDVILYHSMNLHNPMYMGHQVPPSLPLASMLDLIISGLNQSLAVKKMSPVLSEIENDLLRFLCAQIGYDKSSGGTMTSGGSVSNLLGLYAARKKFFPEGLTPEACLICSDQSHFSVSKSANIIGLNNKQIITIVSDDQFKMDTEKTLKTIIDLKKKGYKPFVISASAGSTSTGSFDHIDKLSQIALENDLWLHIDAAHGGSLIFSEKLKHLISGIEKADSIAWDGHKMMFMPSSNGICLFKNLNDLKNCFKDNNAPYLYNSAETNNDLSRLSIQCTRRADALKLWGAILAYGTNFFARRLEYLESITEYFYLKLFNQKNFEVINKPEFNIICFRYNPAKCKINDERLNDINARIRDAVNETGETMLTLTSIKGKVCLRATIINPSTTERHIDAVVELIENHLPIYSIL